MYEAVWGCLHNPDIMFLLPLLAGAGAGTVLTAGLTDKAIKKYPAASYMVITGFVMSSVYDIYPENTDSSRLPINILLCIAGFITVYIITRFADRNKQCS
jgi:putative membrane protein